MKEPQINPLFFPLTNVVKMIMIAVCCVGLNINTIQHEYAHDDAIVINKNMNVNSGFSGIPRIMKTDAFQGFLDMMGASTPLSGGRYRPLSIVSFAIEAELFGETKGEEYAVANTNLNNLKSAGADAAEIRSATEKVKKIEAAIVEQNMKLAPVRHAFHLFWFALSMLVLFIFLDRYLLKDHKDVAFIATLLFVFHPVHTEVVANLKSRDEIFSFMFILTTCILVFKHTSSKSKVTLLMICLSTVAAFLSKEYALLLPLIALSCIHLVNGTPVKAIIMGKWFLTMSITTGIMLLLRQQIIGNKPVSKITDVLNDPFMYADVQQKIATKIAILNEYVKLLVIPRQLSSDYSYSHFPYLSFSSWKVWLALIFWSAVVYLTVKLWRAKHILAFACIFFLGFFMLVNNVFFNIGATMGERLIYHSSLGFCIIIAWLIITGINKLPAGNSRFVLYAMLLLLLVPMGIRTYSRNADWKNNFTLFTTDVRYISNSALTNANAGMEYFNKGYDIHMSIEKPGVNDSLLFLKYVDTAKTYLSKAIFIHPRFVNAYMNRGLCYMQYGMQDSAIADWKMAASFFGGRNNFLVQHAAVIMNQGLQYGNVHVRNYDKAVSLFRDAAAIDPYNPEIWINLGGALYMQGNFRDANHAFNQSLSLNVNSQEAQAGAGVSRNFMLIEEKVQNDSLNLQLWSELLMAYTQGGFKGKADSVKTRIKELNK